MKDNKQFIKEIYEKYEDYQKETKEKSKYVKVEKTIKRKYYIKRVLGVVAIILLVFSFVIINNNNIENEEIKTNEKLSLATVDTFDNFYNIVKNSGNYGTVDDYNTEQEILSDSTIKSESVQSKQRSNSDYSTTNIQMDNVDEADIVKTDGNYIYTVSNKKISIVDVKNPSNLKEVAKIDYTDAEFSPREIYVKNDKLVVIGNTYIYSKDKTVTYDVAFNSTDYIGENRIKTLIYDISHIEEPKEIRSVEIEGSLLSSRMIDNNLYLISNKYINAYNLCKNQIEELEEDDYKPTYKDTAISNEDKKISFNEISYFDNINQTNYLIIAGLDITKNKEANIKTFLGAGEEIYCSENSIYIAKDISEYNNQTREVTNSYTKILKFSIGNSNVEFKAEADIPGYINNQFSMDEKNGYFKIATTSGQKWNLTDSTVNGLYILDDNLKEVGKLTNLAQGEKIYSVRYTDSKAYIVTYEEVDPLFVIDISNPKEPKVLGELKIPGYSTYLHPYDETHLIGFGYDTKVDGTRIKTNGLKMAMFDVSDLENPKELFKVDIGNQYTSSDLLYNHKALLFSKEKNIIAFPISTYSKGRSEYIAQIYNIDLEKGFTLKGEIKHKDNSYLSKIERIIYINNNYYTISQNLIKSINMDTLETEDTLEL